MSIVISETSPVIVQHLITTRTVSALSRELYQYLYVTLSRSGVRSNYGYLSPVKKGADTKSADRHTTRKPEMSEWHATQYSGVAQEQKLRQIYLNCSYNL